MKRYLKLEIQLLLMVVQNNSRTTNLYYGQGHNKIINCTLCWDRDDQLYDKWL